MRRSSRWRISDRFFALDSDVVENRPDRQTRRRRTSYKLLERTRNKIAFGIFVPRPLKTPPTQTSRSQLMKLTLSWLKDHLDTTASLAEIVETLTRIGLEVEGVEDPGAKYAGFVVARVIEAKQHPNADRLRVCMVDAGGEPVQVVCGAPNARTGMKSVFSPVGTYIPGKKITLAKGVIRGVESNGMLCSAAELELSDDHDGIIDLPDDAPVGVAYAAYAGLDDPVIDINLTPNRPDATGVAGIARDLAAAGLGALKDARSSRSRGGFDCPVAVNLDFAPEDEHLCPAFALRLVRGVKNGPSPEWMQQRLRAIGLRPINALVDITNYRHLRSRPAAARVRRRQGRRATLTVRRARAGESVLALDGKTYALDESIVVIADDNGVESIAGVMGGEHSGCDENTTRRADRERAVGPRQYRAHRPQARHRHRRALSLRARRRSRFLRSRRGTRDRSWSWSSAAASRRGSSSPATRPRRAARVDFPYSEVKRLTGLDIPRSRGRGDPRPARLRSSKAARRSCRTGAPTSTARPTSSSRSCASPASTASPSTPLPRLDAGVPKPVLTLLQKRTRLAKRTLAALGLGEAVTWSFISKPHAELFGGGAPALALANPIAADLSDMRPSLIPGLAAAAERNARRGLHDVGAVRGRPGLPRRRRERSAHGGGGAAARHGQAPGRGPALERRRRGRRVRRQGRRAGAARGARRARRRRADRPRRPGVPASRPLGDAAIRPEEHRRLVRRIAPERLRGARRRRAAGRLRDRARRASPRPRRARPRRKPKLERSEFMPRRARPRLRRRRERRARPTSSRPRSPPTARWSPRPTCSTSIAAPASPRA